MSNEVKIVFFPLVVLLWTVSEPRVLLKCMSVNEYHEAKYVNGVCVCVCVCVCVSGCPTHTKGECTRLYLGTPFLVPPLTFHPYCQTDCSPSIF